MNVYGTKRSIWLLISGYTDKFLARQGSSEPEAGRIQSSVTLKHSRQDTSFQNFPKVVVEGDPPFKHPLLPTLLTVFPLPKRILMKGPERE